MQYDPTLSAIQYGGPALRSGFLHLAGVIVMFRKETWPASLPCR